MTWAESQIMTELRAKARAQGLWNLFLPVGHDQPYAEQFGTHGGAGLSNLDYAPVAEAMGRATTLAPYVFNCNAPDTGNMEVLLKYGTAEQKQTWLEPLLDGQIRSMFGMTEPGVASSDATNMAATAVLDGDDVVINGTKWFSTGVGHPDCKVMIFMGLTDPDADRHHRHSMVLVPLDADGVEVQRMLPTMGIYDEPVGHGQVRMTDVRVPQSNLLLGAGRAFEIAQGRLGPGRIHHCMRLIGQAEVALELAIKRGLSRTAFGKPIINLGGNRERIADARMAINRARLLVLHAAWKLDTEGAAPSEVSQIKVVVPNVAQQVVPLPIELTIFFHDAIISLVVGHGLRQPMSLNTHPVCLPGQPLPGAPWSGVLLDDLLQIPGDCFQPAGQSDQPGTIVILAGSHMEHIVQLLVVPGHPLGKAPQLPVTGLSPQAVHYLPPVIIEPLVVLQNILDVFLAGGFNHFLQLFQRFVRLLPQTRIAGTTQGAGNSPGRVPHGFAKLPDLFADLFFTVIGQVLRADIDADSPGQRNRIRALRQSGSFHIKPGVVRQIAPVSFISGVPAVLPVVASLRVTLPPLQQFLKEVFDIVPGGRLRRCQQAADQHQSQPWCIRHVHFCSWFLKTAPAEGCAG